MSIVRTQFPLHTSLFTQGFGGDTSHNGILSIAEGPVQLRFYDSKVLGMKR